MSNGKSHSHILLDDMPARTSEAAVLTQYNKPLEARTYPVPHEVGQGEALVRIEMAGICGTDVHLWRGELPIPLPVILGHETVGRIERLGAGLTKDWRGLPLAEGDRITWTSSIVCGECYYCRIKRQPTRCIGRKAYGISYSADEAPHLRGGYAEYILLRGGSSIFRIPDTLETAAVVGSGCALMTAIHGLERAPVRPGDTVVVQGAGPVGLAALAIARESGASTAIVIGAPDHRLALATEFGADYVISIEAVPDAAARRELVLRYSAPFGADVVVEAVGHPSAVPEGLNLCRDGGTYLVLGQYADAGDVALNPHTITRKQLNVVGSWAFEPRHMDAALNLLDRTNWKHLFAKQVTHRFPLAKANEALETVRRHLSGKAVIVP
jgi:threonine dehydrogenase-like Zn-dependent dehydrogenase